MPGTEVAIGRNSPASLVPGFMSNVSFWLGPPSIQSMIHDLCLTPAPAACAAITSSQPDIDVRAAPAAVNLRKSRRDSSAMRELVMRELQGISDCRLQICMDNVQSAICNQLMI